MMTPNSNVIAFPRKMERELPTYENVIDAAEELTAEQIGIATSIAADALLEAMIALGYDIPIDTSAEADFFMVYECIKAMFMKIHGEDHPFHVISKNAFVKNDDGSYSIVATNIRLVNKDETS